jgi:glycine oxidase
MLIERGELGRESTWAGGGILSPLYPWRYPDAVSVLAKASQQQYPDLCQALLAETGVNPQYRPSGLLYAEDSELTAAKQWARHYGYQLEHLSSLAEMQVCESQVNTHLTHGIYLPEIAQVRNPRIAHALRSSLRLRPITLAEFSPVNELLIENAQVVGVRVGHSVFKAGKVIVTAGAWTSLFPQLQLPSIKIEPVLGQMILFRGEKGLLKRIVMHEGRYLIPRKDGRILCGSTLEYQGFQKHTTEQAKQALRDFAYDLVPALRGLPVLNHWCGLRPSSPNGIPYIGEHPTIKGLYVNAGHYRNGVVLSPASVELLNALVLEQTPQLDPIPYSLMTERAPSL